MAVPTATAELSARERSEPRWSVRRVIPAFVWLWVATRLLLLVISLNPHLYSSGVYGDVRAYGAKVERMFQGELPYRDVAIEYPPGSVPFTLLPGLVVGTGAGYRLTFALEMILIDGLGLYAAWRLARAADRGRRRIPVAYTLGMVVIGPLLVLRFDLIPAVCVLLAAALAAEGRAGPSAAALGYGAAAKLFPAVLAPLLVLGLVPAEGWRRSLRRTVPPFLLAFAVTLVPALVISASGTLDSLLYHIRRGVQIESLPANLVDLAHLAFGVGARSVYGFGAYDLQSDMSGAMKLVSTVATAAALAGAAWLVWRRSSGAAGGRGLRPADWAGAFAIGVFAFVLPTRVLSPQYLVWLVAPVAGLADRSLGRRAMWALVAAAALSQLEFPFRYTQLRHLDWVDISVLTCRNLLLVAAGVLVVRAFRARAPEVEQTIPEEGPEMVTTHPA
jgi:Glycosyltransferase family 87